MRKQLPTFVSTRNACKLCTPMGACFVFKGVEGCVPFLHGSQGCSTYVRRYMISHFKEPVDVASSNFGEASAIFGGGDNLWLGLDNVIRQYHPLIVGIASTCLSETIGDDVAMSVHQYKKQRDESSLPAIVHVSTPSYQGTHIDGFHAAVRAMCDLLAREGQRSDHLNIMPGMVSPADIRYLREILNDFHADSVILPDYSATLDGPIWTEYSRIPKGGTPLADIRRTASAQATIEFGATWNRDATAGALLETRFQVPRHELPWPVGVSQTDAFFQLLEQLTGTPTPEVHRAERGRLIDSIVDSHKHVFGKRVAVFGEEDLVVALATFLAEVGLTPVICASGGKSGRLKATLDTMIPEQREQIDVREDVDFLNIEDLVRERKPDLLVGNSKGYSLSRKLEIPLVRVGFPIHDRIGGARVLHLGYRGAQQLFDRVANTVIQTKQDRSPVGYTYM